mmetsp:Transcript_86059/g.256773  ORF Transcript_86059/g.256773 Transcript_86059/m.256773 type:complete len:242 (+) Transcript_86059:183-908(+)
MGPALRLAASPFPSQPPPSLVPSNARKTMSFRPGNPLAGIGTSLGRCGSIVAGSFSSAKRGSRGVALRRPFGVRTKGYPSTAGRRRECSLVHTSLLQRNRGGLRGLKGGMAGVVFPRLPLDLTALRASSMMVSGPNGFAGGAHFPAGAGTSAHAGQPASGRGSSELAPEDPVGADRGANLPTPPRTPPATPPSPLLRSLGSATPSHLHQCWGSLRLCPHRASRPRPDRLRADPAGGRPGSS